MEQLDKVPWAILEHALGFAEDVPDLLRKLMVSDLKVRKETMNMLYSNVLHQGTRFPATPYVIPFLIELCSSPQTLERKDLLRYWKSLITGYFSIQQRPIWGDGKNVYFGSEIQNDEPFAESIHQVYAESLKGHDVLLRLLHDEVPMVRAASAGVLACLPTVAAKSGSVLKQQLASESIGWVRAAIVFALGELGFAESLRDVLAQDDEPAARCMAACELARVDPDASLVDHLIYFVSEPIDGYESIPGAGGNSSGDAAYAISYLPKKVQLQAAPEICKRLKQSLLFDTVPLVATLLSAAFERSDKPLVVLNESQRSILRSLVDCQELWAVWELSYHFDCYGLPFNRRECAELVGDV